MFFVLAFLAAHVNPVFAGDDPVSFLVWRGSFTVEEITEIRGYGHKKDNQPVRITEYFQPPNTNYAKITITPTTDKQDNDLKSLLVQGKIQKLQTVYIKGVYDARIGGNVVWAEKEDCRSAPWKYVCLPTDWERNWADVEISSP